MNIKLNYNIRLHVNENHFVNPFIEELNLNNSIECFVNYPDSGCCDLAQKMAGYYNIDVSNLFFGNGLDEIIALLVLCLSREGEKIIYPENTFNAYGFCSHFFHRVSETVKLKDYKIDIAELLEKIKMGAKIVFLCNPHNPTGSFLSCEEMLAILQECKNAGTYLVIDEAYYEFCGITLGFLEATSNSNLIILRTMSKFYGMAGVRLGYAVSTKENIKLLNQIKTFLPFNVNHFAQAYGGIIFDHINKHKKEILNSFNSAKIFLCNNLEAMSLSYLPSASNFVTLNLGVDAANITEKLKTSGILVRYCKDWNLPELVRVTVGTEAEILVFMETLGKLLH